MIRQVTVYEVFVILRNLFIYGFVFVCGARSAYVFMSWLYTVLSRLLSRLTVHCQTKK